MPWAAILYELLTGRPPFKAETAMDTMLQVLPMDPVPPTRLQPKVPRDLETICLKCLHKEPARRYATAEALADDLRRFLNGEPIQARAISIMGRGVKWARRRPATAALLGVVGLFLASLFVVTLAFSLRLRKANVSIEQQYDEAQMQRMQAEHRRQVAVAAQSQAPMARKLAEDRLEHSRRSLYAFQLMQVANQCRRDPVQAMQLLHDPERCPKDLRDFTWSYLDRLGQRERREWQGIKGISPALAVSTDGKMLASAGDDSVKVIPVVGNDASWSFPIDHRDATVAVAFSPDGRGPGYRQLRPQPQALGHPRQGNRHSGRPFRRRSLRRILRRRQAAGLRQPRSLHHPVGPNHPETAPTLKGHTNSVSSIAFSPDGKILASGAADSTVRLWDVAAARLLATLPGHTGEVRSVAFAPSGKYLASAGADRTVRLWDAVVAKPLDVLHGHLDAVNAVAFSRDGKTLASASTDRTVRLWQPATGEMVTVLRHTVPLITLAFVGRDELAVLGKDQTIKLWDVNFAPERHLQHIDFGLAGEQKPITSFAPDGRTLAVVNRANSNIQLCDLPARKQWVVVQKFTRPVDCVAVSPDGKLLAAGADDHTIRLYDAAGRPKRNLEGPQGPHFRPWVCRSAHLDFRRGRRQRSTMGRRCCRVGGRAGDAQGPCLLPGYLAGWQPGGFRGRGP